MKTLWIAIMGAIMCLPAWAQDWQREGRCSVRSGDECSQRFVRYINGVRETTALPCIKIRATTLNIHGGMDTNATLAGGEALRAVADLIIDNQVDVAFLQEVEKRGIYHNYFTAPAYSDNLAYIRSFTSQYGYRSIYSKQSDQFSYVAGTTEPERDSNGNVIRKGTNNIATFLSNRMGPVTWLPNAGSGDSWHTSEDLHTWSQPDYYRKRRALIMRINMAGYEPLMLFNVHLSPHNMSDFVSQSIEKQAQLTNMLFHEGWFNLGLNSVIIGGDFNLYRLKTNDKAEAMRTGDAAYTWPLKPANEQLEWRFKEQFGVNEYRRLHIQGWSDAAFQGIGNIRPLRVDFLFHKRLRAENYQTWRPVVNGVTISDHPVVMTDYWLSPLAP